METEKSGNRTANQPNAKRSVAARRNDLDRIQNALRAAASLLMSFQSSGVTTEFKSEGDPVTSADRAVNGLLWQMLLRDGEGWLSEESADDPSRLARPRVWMVDPIDGTKEFIAGIPEWCVSIGLVEDGQAVAGGICIPAIGGMIFGSLETGVTVQFPKRPVFSHSRKEISVLASRSEVNRGEWEWLQDSPFSIMPVGSVAYKLALVAAGCAAATWTFVPKHEWDVAAGVALVLASGGDVTTPDGRSPSFNRSRPLLQGLIAVSAEGRRLHRQLLGEWVSKGGKARV